MMKFLVIDVGTSACRAAVVSSEGKLLSQSRRPFSLDQSRPSWAEIDTDRLWFQIQKVIRSEVAKHSARAFAAIGVSAMLGYVYLDQRGQPLMPAITYADNRATAAVERIQDLFPQDKYFAITGRRLSPLLLAPKILWLAEHRPQTYSKLDRIIGLKDEIIHRLCGRIRTDVAHLDYSGLYNVTEGHLESELLDALGIKSSLFAAPSPAAAVAGTVTTAAAEQLNLTQGTPVIVGSSDGTTAMYGGGILVDGNAVLVSGTTDVLMMFGAAAPRNPSLALMVNSGMLPGTYLVGGPLGLSGGCLQYFEGLLQTSAHQLDQKISDLSPGSEGLLIHPGLTGERSPYWNAYLAGAISGLSPNHKSEHLLRAVMEGSALRILKLLNILSQTGLRPRALNLVGGGANIDVWNQIRADVCGLAVQKLSITEATCLGTALFCWAALDKNRSLPEISGDWIEVAQQYRPDPDRTRRYQPLARLFERYIETNADLYRALNEFRG